MDTPHRWLVHLPGSDVGGLISCSRHLARILAGSSPRRRARHARSIPARVFRRLRCEGVYRDRYGGHLWDFQRQHDPHGTSRVGLPRTPPRHRGSQRRGGGCRQRGATGIWVKDGHDSGENLVREALHPAADLVAGTPAIPGHLPGLDESFDAMFLIGFHARMGTRHAHFDHTVNTAVIAEVRLNGTAVGEIGIYAAEAGRRGVPVTLVTGDAAATCEARDLLGAIETVAVKDGLGRFSARVPAPESIYPRIRDAAAQALQTETAVPWVLPPPITVAVDFLRSAEADMAEMVPGTDGTDERANS